MRLRNSSLLVAVVGLSVLLGGCQLFGGAKNQSTNTALTITLDQLVGSWESQTQSVGKTGYFYSFDQDGTLTLSEETRDNLVLNGTFAIEQGGKILNIQLTNPRDGAVILAMSWTLINAEANELVFKLMPDDGVVWLKRVR